MKLAFLGAGKMATAIAAGVVEKQLLPVTDMIACDVYPAARTAFTTRTGVECRDFAPEVFADCDALLLAVKPQKAEEAMAALPALKANCLVISIMAGVPICRLNAWSGTQKVIRVMPNTPMMVARGATVFARGTDATDADAEFVSGIFGALGYVNELAEEQIDAVTALSGSGPAYIFEMIQALCEAGQSVGLPADVALDLTVQTVAGAAEMVQRKMGTPEELRIAVTSPGGTTAAGLAVFEQAAFRKLVGAVVTAARDRSIELGKLS